MKKDFVKPKEVPKTSEISLEDAQLISEWIIEQRRALHKRPELSYHEHETAKFIATKLREMGVEVKEGVGGTGVVGLLKGARDGRTVALRADIDALPIREANDVPYKSINDNCMHACGHDGHISMLLGAARLMAGIRDTICGNVKFIFQPAEEAASVGGAKGMIEDGVLENPHVDAIFGLHIWPELPSGVIGVKPGPIMAAHDRVAVKIKGSGGHGALPHLSRDAVITAAHAILGLQNISSRNINPLFPVVLSVCHVSGGSQYNVLPDEVFFEATTRYFQPELGTQIEGLINQIVDGICRTSGCTYELDYEYGFPPVVNDSRLASVVERAANKLLSKDQINIVEHPAMTGEDFSIFLQEIPGCFYWLGNRNVEKDTVYPLHSARFQIDEDILPIGSAMMSKIALEFLSEH